MHKLTLLALLLLPLPAFAEPSITSLAANESTTNGGPNHPTALLADQNHADLWLASEGQGLWRFHQASADNPWQQFPKAAPATGPGDDFLTALAQDKKHRLWIGTNNHGVSVFNGKAWETYNTWGPSAGPAGQHVYALAADPDSGDVYIATNAGLTIFHDSSNTWSSLSRADGLPADQFRAIAISPTTHDLFLATAADGLLIHHAADDFTKWDVRLAHPPLADHEDPMTPTGQGLPSNLCNALAIDPAGRIFLGTPTGLALSTDNGKTFSFLRGKDWSEKVERRYNGAPEAFKDKEFAEALLSEDWITALTLDSQNKLWIGHRTTGLERFDPDSQKILLSQTDSPMLDTGKACINYVRGIAISPNGPPLIARYLVPPTFLTTSDAMLPPAKLADASALAVLPAPAAPPTIEELKAWQSKFTNLRADDKPIPAGSYISEDWTTAGDWIGHIGRQFARLGAQDTFAADGYAASVTLGGHYPNLSVDSISFALNPNLPRQGLLNPAHNARTISELNDQSFDDSVSSYAVQGPDLWIKCTIPANGPHRISIYCLNPDGQTSRNSLRDYVLELRPDTRVKPADGAADTAPADNLSAEDRLALEKLPILAHARASDMFPGHYQQFLVRDPGLYWIKINRNHAFVTKLFGIFIDQIGPTADAAPHAGYTYDNDPPTLDLTKIPAKSDREAEARKLWQLAEKSWHLPTAETLIPRAQLLAYRAADADHANPDLLTLWRWKLPLWSTPDRDLFDQHTIVPTDLPQ